MAKYTVITSCVAVRVALNTPHDLHSKAFDTTYRACLTCSLFDMFSESEGSLKWHQNSLPLCVSFCLSLSVSVYLFVSVCLSVCLSLFRCVCVCVSPYPLLSWIIKMCEAKWCHVFRFAVWLRKKQVGLPPLAIGLFCLALPICDRRERQRFCWSRYNRTGKMHWTFWITHEWVTTCWVFYLDFFFPSLSLSLSAYSFSHIQINEI